MILTNSHHRPTLLIFGIKIPSLHSRTLNILKNLRSEQNFPEKEHLWLINGFKKQLISEDLLGVHSEDYTAGFFDNRTEQRIVKAFELMTPDGKLNRWEPQTALRPLTDFVPLLLKSMAGTYEAGCIALKEGFCHYLGGGMHHGHRDFGHGFCPFNDVAIAIRMLQKERLIRTVCVIDVDAHKGDGTAAVFADDETVKTLSVHMAHGWPLDGSLPENHPSFIPSDVDIPIASGEEHSYTERLSTGLRTFLAKGSFDLAFVLAGADPYEKDALPSTALMRLSSGTLLERDQLIYSLLEESGIPSAWLLAGGYGEHAWSIHAAFLRWVLKKRMEKDFWK